MTVNIAYDRLTVQMEAKAKASPVKIDRQAITGGHGTECGGPPDLETMYFQSAYIDYIGLCSASPVL